jgi:hypothetical protein
LFGLLQFIVPESITFKQTAALAAPVMYKLSRGINQ